jgi:hypothetical protein
MDQLIRSGFALSDELLLDSDGMGGLFITGRIPCLGGIYIDVRKHVVCIGGEGGERLVQTAEYSYNVVLQGRGNIFRYDSPHIDHNREHHVHRYNVLNGDTDGAIEWIYDEEKRPTLQEVVLEAEEWYYAHRDRL